MKRMDLVEDKSGNGWVAQSGGKTVPGTKADRKEDAIRKAAAKAKASPEPVTLKIHKKDGRIQEERTYPKKSDPPASRG